jgi:hypothetical protein
MKTIHGQSLQQLFHGQHIFLFLPCYKPQQDNFLGCDVLLNTKLPEGRMLFKEQGNSKAKMPFGTRIQNQMWHDYKVNNILNI